MLILAVAVVAVRAGSTGTVDAATGTINVLNVGTCYTTDTDIFSVGDCKDGELEEQDDGTKADTAYNVGGRDSITEADTVFATYAVDPKTSGDQPRAILKYADLIKVSIEDKGRDKRTGKLYAVSNDGTVGGASIPTGGILTEAQTMAIGGILGRFGRRFSEHGMTTTTTRQRTTPRKSSCRVLRLTSTEVEGDGRHSADNL